MEEIYSSFDKHLGNKALEKLDVARGLPDLWELLRKFRPQLRMNKVRIAFKNRANYLRDNESDQSLADSYAELMDEIEIVEDQVNNGTFKKAEPKNKPAPLRVVFEGDEPPFKLSKRYKTVKRNHCIEIYLDLSKGDAFKEIQRASILDIIDYLGGNIHQTAKVLGLSYRGLYLKMKTLGITNEAS